MLLCEQQKYVLKVWMVRSLKLWICGSKTLLCLVYPSPVRINFIPFDLLHRVCS